MGGTPAWALLSLSLPRADVGWLRAFADGFSRLATAHGVALVGGDTTGGPLSVMVQALGFVPAGEGLRRSGGTPGDCVCVSGTPGDAAGRPRDPTRPQFAGRARPSLAVRPIPVPAAARRPGHRAARLGECLHRRVRWPRRRPRQARCRQRLRRPDRRGAPAAVAGADARARHRSRRRNRPRRWRRLTNCASPCPKRAWPASPRPVRLEQHVWRPIGSCRPVPAWRSSTAIATPFTGKGFDHFAR